jgi:hypothetical protein
MEQLNLSWFALLANGIMECWNDGKLGKKTKKRDRVYIVKRSRYNISSALAHLLHFKHNIPTFHILKK